MNKINARILASLLWLKARYDVLTSRPGGQALILLFFVGMGFFFSARPVYACEGVDVECWIQSAMLFITTLVAGFLGKLIAVVLEFMIPVMLYNSFSSSPVVTAGWALVRDTVNMCFVIILIIIAFGTIFGHSKFKWQQQVPKLLIFAIVINFSKTLARIMIDFGQVIMLTFANALREIAAGNIIELFGLNKVSAFSESAKGTPALDWDLVMAGLASVFVLAWVLVIMVLLFAILIYRVVALWILIVIAPLAWFAGGAKDIISSNAYEDWWAKFKCLVAIGPVLTFFLWLALSVAGAGAAAKGFDTGTVALGDSTNLFTKIFEFQHFMSMVIGSAMLIAGLQMAQQICSVMSGTFLGKSLGKAVAFGPGMIQFGKGAALKTAGWTGRKIGAGARATGRASARGAGMLARTNAGQRIGLGNLTSEARSVRARERAEAQGSGVWGRMRARQLLAKAQRLEGARPEAIAKATEQYSQQSTDVKAGLLSRFARSPVGKLGQIGGNEDEVLGRFKDALGNKDVMAKLEKSGDLAALWKNYGSKMETTFRGDKATTEQLQSFKKRHAHLTGSVGDLKSFEDFQNLSDEAMKDQSVRTHASNTKISVKDGNKTKQMNAMAAILDGKFGNTKKDLVQGGYDAFDDSQLRAADMSSVAQSGSLQTVHRAAMLALQDGKITRVNDATSQLIAQYKNQDTTDEQRFAIAGVLDSLKADLAQQHRSGSLKGVYANQLKALEQTFAADRQSAESAVNRVGSDANYGKIPSVITQNDPAAFVQQNFANASRGRKADAAQQLSAQLDEKQNQAHGQVQEMTTAVLMQNGSLSQEAQGIKQEVDRLWQTFRDARKAAEDRAKLDVQALKTQSQSKQKEIEAKADQFKSAKKSGQNPTVLARIEGELTSLKAEKTALDDQVSAKAPSVDEEVSVVASRQAYETKQQELKQKLTVEVAGNPASSSDLQARLAALADTQQEKDKLAQAVAAIEALRRSHV